MTSAQKTAASLLTTIILFLAFVVLAFSGLFSVIDARFYEPTKVKMLRTTLCAVADAYDEYINLLDSRFATGENAFIKKKAVLSYVESNPDDALLRERTKITGDLFSETQGLSGIRLVDVNGNSIHYSSFRNDVGNKEKNVISYKNYRDVVTLSGLQEIPFEKIASEKDLNNQNPMRRIYFDSCDSRIIFSYPFYDKYSVFRGTFLFYVNASDFNQFLLKKNLITIDSRGTIVSENCLTNEELEGKEFSEYGFVFGIPSVGSALFNKAILLKWQSSSNEIEKLLEIDSASKDERHAETTSKARGKTNTGDYWVLLNGKKCAGGFVSGVYRDDIFKLPHSAEVLILLCIFVSLFLIVFLIFNIKQDDMTVIKSRIKNLQLGVVNEYLKKKDSVDWNVVRKKVLSRRDDVTKEIIKSLGGRGKKYKDALNELIDKSWNELLAAMDVPNLNEKSSIENVSEIKQMLQEVLSSGTIKVEAANVNGVALANSNGQAGVVKNSAPEQVEKLDEVDSLDEIQPAEDVEEVEELDEVDSLDEIQPAEEVGEVEELEDAEPVEELDEVENFAPVEYSQNPLLDVHEPFKELDTAVDEILSQSAQDVVTKNITTNAPLLKNAPKNESLKNDEFEELEEVDFFDDDEDNPPRKKSLLARAKRLNAEHDENEEAHRERFEFGEPARVTNSKEIDFAPLNISAIDYTSLDSKTQNQKHASPLKMQNNATIENTVSTKINEVLPLNQDGAVTPFSLTQIFSSTKTSVPELESEKNETILSDDDGVFYINDDIETNSVIQDVNFKSLVDSVLKR